MLAQCRFDLRPELVEPRTYFSRVKTKWPQIHRSLPLEWSGREHMVSSKTIELMHDLTSLLKVTIFKKNILFKRFMLNWQIEFFCPKNSGVSKNAGKHTYRRGEDGSIDIMVQEDWSRPQAVKDIKQGVRNYNLLCWSLHKHNFAGKLRFL